AMATKTSMSAAAVAECDRTAPPMWASMMYATVMASLRELAPVPERSTQPIEALKAPTAQQAPAVGGREPGAAPEQAAARASPSNSAQFAKEPLHLHAPDPYRGSSAK